MNKRLNITLPEQTVKLIDRVVTKGQRSRLIDHAVKRYIEEESRTNLRKQLANSYATNARLDRELVEEWFPLEQEAWQDGNH
jgi:CopG family transcriptional regulator / antitoxin EndoAI